MQRNHYKKSGTIAQLFEEDKKALHPLPPVPFEVYRLELVKADNYGKVKNNNKRYSSSPAYAGRQLWLKAGAFEVVLLDDKYKEIIRHSRLYGRQTESMQWAPYLELMVKSSDLVTATTAFTDTLKRGLSDPDSIWSNYIRLTSGSYEMELTELPPKVPELSSYQIDTSIYDLLLKGGGYKWRQ